MCWHDNREAGAAPSWATRQYAYVHACPLRGQTLSSIAFYLHLTETFLEMTIKPWHASLCHATREVNLLFQCLESSSQRIQLSNQCNDSVQAKYSTAAPFQGTLVLSNVLDEHTGYNHSDPLVHNSNRFIHSRETTIFLILNTHILTRQILLPYSIAVSVY